MISVSFCADKIPNFELFSRIYPRNSKKLQYGDISCNKYSKQIPSMISSYGETQANSYFSRNRNPKLTHLVSCHFFSPLPAPSGGFYDFLRDIIWDHISKLLLLMGCRTNSDEHLSQNVRNSRITPSLSHWWKFHNLYMYRGGYK